MDGNRIASKLAKSYVNTIITHRVEWVEYIVLDAIAASKIPHVIRDDINHQIHTSTMQSLRKCH